MWTSFFVKREIPKEIDGAKVLLYTSIDDRHVYNKAAHIAITEKY